MIFLLILIPQFNDTEYIHCMDNIKQKFYIGNNLDLLIIINVVEVQTNKLVFTCFQSYNK